MSKIKCIFFDCDGVVVVADGMHSMKFAQEYGVPQEQLLEFFTGPFKKCMTGEADTKEELKPYLEQWGYDKELDDYFSAWHAFEDKPDQELLDDIQRIRKRGVLCCMATNQEHYRTAYLKDKMNFSSLFDAIYTSSETGLMKHDQACMQDLYRRVNEIQPIKKEEILFIDDDQKNIDSANQFGFKGILYRQRSDLESLPEFQELLREQ